MSKYKSSQTAFLYVTIGLQLAITVTAFVFGGYYLDNRFKSSPLYVTIGAVLGMILGFYHLIKQLKDIEEREKRRKTEEKKSSKWM